MALKPTEKPAWVSGDEAARIQEPFGSKKLTGFKKNERPPFNFLNWLFNILSHWLNYFSGNAQYNVIIDSDTDEGDYTSMAAYVADSPSADDRILTKIDEVLTGTLIFPAGVEFTQEKGKKFTLTANFSPIIQFAKNVTTKGDFRVENSNTGTIAKGFSINGDDNHHDNLIIENASTGIITNGVHIEVGVDRTYAQAQSINSGAGTITNDLTDNSGNDENHVTVKGDAGISRSRGAKKFDQPDITDFTNMQHDHGDIDDGGNVLSIPTITNFTNAQHDHGDANDGGALVSSTFRARKTVDQTISTGTETKVEFATKDFDTNNDFSLANERFTPTIAGKYLIIGAAEISGFSDQDIFSLRIERNGSTIAWNRTAASGAGARSKNVIALVDMNGSTDYVELFAFHNHGSDLTIENNAYVTLFMGHKIN